MNRIKMLISQIDCVSEMVTARFQNERANLTDQLFSKLVLTHQKVSLAEKQHNVKNACSHHSSENPLFLIK